MAWVAALVAACAGAAFWFSHPGEPDTVLVAATPQATPAHSPVPLAAAAAAAPEVEEVSTSAILQDTPAVTDKVLPAAKSKAPADELVELLASEPATAVATSHPRPSAESHPRVNSKPEVKPAAREHASHQLAAKIAAPHHKPAAPAKATPAPDVDSDVALLAALVAHSKAHPEPASPAARKLKQCKALRSVDEAEQCRARLCAGSARNEAECKAPGVAKVADAT